MRMYVPIFALTLIFLSGCDKGRRSLDNLHQTFPFIQGTVTLENIRDLRTAIMGLEILAAAHAKEGSGAEATKELAALREKVRTLAKATLPDYHKALKEVVESLQKAEKFTDKIQKDIRATRTKSLKEEKYKPGECYAFDFGKEFDNESSLFEIRIVRIEKVGQEAALTKYLFQADKGEKIPADWISQMDEKAAEEQEFILLHAGKKIDCARAEELRKAFQEAAPVQARNLDLTQKMQTMQDVLGEDLTKL